MSLDVSSSNWTYAETPDLPAGVYVASAVYLSAVGIVGFVGNFTVVIAFALKKEVTEYPHRVFVAVL